MILCKDASATHTHAEIYPAFDLPTHSSNTTKPELAKERSNRLLRLRRQAGKQLIRIQARSLHELPRGVDDPLRHIALQRLRLQRLRDKGEAACRLRHDGGTLSVKHHISLRERHT